MCLDRPFPTFPHGFPPRRHRRVRAADRPGHARQRRRLRHRDHRAARGRAHVRPGKPIVYTSADSVFQIAAHEGVIPIDEQYRICEIAFELVGRRHRRRPGHRAAVRRRARRVHAGPPTGTTTRWSRPGRRCSTGCRPTGLPVVAVGKVSDLFAGRGITRESSDDRATANGMDRVVEAMARHARGADLRQPGGLRRAVRPSERRCGLRGEPRALRRAPGRGAGAASGHDDLLVITADHGNDPTTPSTDHSREYVPVLLAGGGGPGGRRRRHPADVRRSRSDAGRELRRGAAGARHELPGGDRCQHP